MDAIIKSGARTPQSAKIEDFSIRDDSQSGLRVKAIMGTLGSGKTSLIRSLEANGGLARSVVLENDIGKADFDASYLNSCGIRVVALRAGCICCQDFTSLRLSLQEFASSKDNRYSSVIIEPTGVAEPDKIRGLLEDLGLIFDVTMMVNVKDFESNLKAGRLKGHLEAADKVLFSWWDHMESLEFQEKMSKVMTYVKRVAPDVPFAFITGQGEIATINLELPASNPALPRQEKFEHDGLEAHGHYHRQTIGVRPDLTQQDIESFVAGANFAGINILRMKGNLPDFSFHVVGNQLRVAGQSSIRMVTDLITDAPVPQWLIDSIRVRADQTSLAFSSEVIEAQEKIVEALKFPVSAVSKNGKITTEFEADEGWNYVDNQGFSPTIRENFYRSCISLKCQGLEAALTPEYKSDPNLGYYLKRLGGALTWFLSNRYEDLVALDLVERVKALDPATQYFAGLACIQDSVQLGGVSSGDPQSLMQRMSVCQSEIGKEKAFEMFAAAYQNIKRLDQDGNWIHMLEILQERIATAQ